MYLNHVGEADKIKWKQKILNIEALLTIWCQCGLNVLLNFCGVLNSTFFVVYYSSITCESNIRT